MTTNPYYRMFLGILAGAGDAEERSSTRVTGVGAPLTLVVEAGECAGDPDLVRVLDCALDRATSRGLGFVVR